MEHLYSIVVLFLLVSSFIASAMGIGATTSPAQPLRQK